MSTIDIGKWNYLRNGLEYNPELEQNMLDEEAKEFKDAFTTYLALTTSDAYYPEDILLDEVVDMVDAYCDYMYVYTGTVLKSIGLKVIDGSHTQSIMHSVLTEVLLTHGVRMYEGKGTLPLLEEAFQYVIQVNSKKPLPKTKGKLTKGRDIKDPKELIKDLLKSKGFTSSVEEALENYKKTIEEAISTKPKQVSIDEIN